MTTNTNPASTLAACPFCDGKPDGPKQDGWSDERSGYNFSVSINCKTCSATITRESHHNKAGWCDDQGQAVAAVTEAWNRRGAGEAQS